MKGSRHAFEGFSIVLPPGWEQVVDDTTYSDPDEVAAAAFKTSAGTLQVTPVLLEEDEDPGTTPEAARALALEWGLRRGLATPLGLAAGAGTKGATATATYRLGADFVQVWFLTNGRDVIQASYVVPWDAQEAEREAVAAVVSSLRFY